MPDAEVILVGEALETSDGSVLVLRPEAFLKGPTSADEVRLGSPSQPDDLCPRAKVSVGDRVLVYIFQAGELRYPLINQLYLLRDGQAVMDGQEPRSEVEVVSSIRAITGQYAVPAATQDEGAGIDWGNTVIPLGVVLLVIFGIGLVLMRVWHRIDPS